MNKLIKNISFKVKLNLITSKGHNLEVGEGLKQTKNPTDC